MLKKYLASYKSNIPIILLIFYSLGYIYLNRYYHQFNISIENYITLTDIIFITVNTIIKLSIIYLIFDFFLLIISNIILKIFYSRKLNHKIKGRVDNNKIYNRYYSLVIKKQIEKQMKYVSFYLSLICLFILLFSLSDKIYIFTIYIPYFLVKIHPISHSKENKNKRIVVQIFLLIFSIMLIISFANLGSIDGLSVKTSQTSKIIEFTENQKYYNVNSDSLNYIGETSSFIFIYDKKNRKSLIFQKNNISNYKIKDTSLTNEEKEELKKETEEK